MADLGTTLGQNASESNRMNSELSVASAGDITILDLHSASLEVWNSRVKEKEQSITENGVTESFILSSPLAGLLGINKLGSSLSSYITTSVTNAHDLFPEGFWNDRFISTGSSTGSEYIADTTGYYLIASGSYLQTEYIAWEDKVYKSVLIDIDSEYVATGANANSNISAYAYINNLPYTLTIGVKTTFSNTSNDGLKIKLLNNATGSDIKINSFTAKYTGIQHYYISKTYAIDTYNDTYREYINTTTFNNTSESNATWNTITQEITF